MNDNNQAPPVDAGARDDPLPQDRAWIIPKAVGLMAAYRDCKWEHESKAVMDEFVVFMRAALATAPTMNAETTGEQKVLCDRIVCERNGACVKDDVATGRKCAAAK